MKKMERKAAVTITSRASLGDIVDLKLPDQRWVLEVLEILAGLWGYLRPARMTREEPLDGLILTVLSQNTNDKNRDRAYALLKARFPKWDEVLAATHEEIASVIRPAGLSNVKAMRIKEILKIVSDHFGDCSLRDLRKMKKGDIVEFLSSLPGVGPKTVACVLLFDLGLPAFPVDTHVGRLCKRIGWVSAKCSPPEIQKIMESIIPEELYWSAHLDLISHGRNICLARRPQCGECPLNERKLCLYPLEGDVDGR